MPNNVYQQLFISNLTDKDFSELKEIFEEKDFLNKIVACPEELEKVIEDKYVKSLERGVPFIQVYQSVISEVDDPKEREETLANLNLAKDCLKKYGYTSWRTWRYKHWGTGWHTYNYDVEFEEDSIYASFDTANSNCSIAIDSLAQMYPKASIELRYADEDLGHNCGEITWENGSRDSENIPEDYNEAFKLAIEIRHEEQDWYFDEKKDKFLSTFYQDNNIIDDVSEAELDSRYYFGNTREEVIGNANDTDSEFIGTLIKKDPRKGFLLETEQGTTWANYLIKWLF